MTKTQMMMTSSSWLICWKEMSWSQISSAQLLAKSAWRSEVRLLTWSSAQSAGRIILKSTFTLRANTQLAGVEFLSAIMLAQMVGPLMEILNTMYVSHVIVHVWLVLIMETSVIRTSVSLAMLAGNFMPLNRNVWKHAHLDTMKSTQKHVISVNGLAWTALVTNSTVSNVMPQTQTQLCSHHQW